LTDWIIGIHPGDNPPKEADNDHAKEDTYSVQDTYMNVH
jgi:hypothetical protein